MKIDEIPISTKTIIASANCTFDIVKIFQTYPIRARTDGGVEVMYYQNEYRGVVYADFYPRKKKNFRNAINVISHIENGRKINFKLSKNGKFQLTGCKNEDHAIQVVKNLIDTVLTHCRDCIQLQGPMLVVSFQTVMTNIDFSLGFSVDRQKLDNMMNNNTPFHSLLETSFGYTGVNIKFPVDQEWWKLPVPVISKNTGTESPWIKYERPLHDFVANTETLQKKMKYNTFLVFHSGSVIMSGMVKETMRLHYDLFVSIMKTWQPRIEEKLIVQ